MEIKSPIILIGPSGVGKSIVCKNLSHFLHLPTIGVDEGGFDRYKKHGFSFLIAKILFLFLGHFWVYRYSKPYEFIDTVNILSSIKNEVVDLGAGSIIYHNKKHQKKIKEILSTFNHIFLLLPSPDKKESLNYLNKMNPHLASLKPNINEYYNNFNYKEFAKYTFYVKDKSLYQISQEIGDIVIKDNQILGLNLLET